jgi:hypothetical protein
MSDEMKTICGLWNKAAESGRRFQASAYLKDEQRDMLADALNSRKPLKIMVFRNDAKFNEPRENDNRPDVNFVLGIKQDD